MKKRMPVSYVGNMIKTAREKKNLSVEELADKINKPNITAKLLRQWEKGKKFPDLDSIYILAQELDLNPNEMLNNRITIQYESIHEVDWSKRRVGAYLFDTIHSLTIVGVKLVGMVVAIILLFYTITAVNLMSGNQAIEEPFVVRIIDNTIEHFVPDWQNVVDPENVVQNEN